MFASLSGMRLVRLYVPFSQGPATFVVNKETICSKFPKISNTEVSDKMAYASSADADQTAPECLFQ